MKLHATVNGRGVDAEVDPTSSLLELLRAEGLTGTKQGCEVGVCGLCTVLVDGMAVSSCLYLAACADGVAVTTVEGLAQTDPALVDAFVEAEGLQCGICTPGQVVMAAAVARGAAEVDLGATDQLDHQLRRALGGNLCRCTGYLAILDAVKAYLAR